MIMRMVICWRGLGSIGVDGVDHNVEAVNNTVCDVVARSVPKVKLGRRATTERCLGSEAVQTSHSSQQRECLPIKHAMSLLRQDLMRLCLQDLRIRHQDVCPLLLTRRAMAAATTS